jgi:hypothetical protein
MTKVKFDEITKKCQPHQVFSSDWSHYYSRDFADTLLPQVGLTKGKAIEFYDGADILPNDNHFPRHFLQLVPDNTLISLTLFSYPKGVKAEQKKLTVQPEKFELCLFFEIDINDKISIFLKSGDNFKTALQAIAETKKITDVSTTIGTKSYTTTLNSFQAFFKDEYSHYQVLNFVGKMLGIDLEAQHNATVLKVHINTVKAYTSEPSDNYKRKVKEKKNKYIKVDFEIINQPAINYSLYVYKDGQEIYQITNLPEIIIANKSNQTINAPTSPNDFRPGKYTIEWDCTDNKIFDTQNEVDKITVRIQATNQYKETAISQLELSVKELINKAEKNNYIIILKPQFKVNKDKTKEQINDKQVKVFANEILERQRKFVSQIPQNIFEKLTDEEKLILNLPIIMTKLDFIHGALCQIHWLEGSKESIKFPYEFFMSEERITDIDAENLKIFFEEVEYLSEENLGYHPSNPDGKQLFLYDDSIPSIKDALSLFNDNLSKRNENGYVGGNENLISEITTWEEIKKDPNKKRMSINETFFQSFSIGSAFGNIDNVGTALGRFSQRCYFKAMLLKDTDSKKWSVNVEEVKCRFFDEFSFNDNLIDFGPIEYSQPLGCWHTDLAKPKQPHYTKVHTPDGSTVCLQNKDYKELQKALSLSKNLKASPVIPNSCNDFFIYSDIKIFKDEFIQKIILIL